MKACPECGKEAAADARYCSHCGASLATPMTSSAASASAPSASNTASSPASATTATSSAPSEPAAGATTSSPDTTALSDDEQVWRQFIGPKADHYLTKFRRFTSPAGPKYALTWNWAAFLCGPFLWFLYRKMYLYAFVYAIGPIVATTITHDLSAIMVWGVMAGASANYLYYWHIKEKLGEIKKQAGFNYAQRTQLIEDAGGVQAYVIWVGVGLFLLGLLSLAMNPPAHDTPSGTSKGVQSSPLRIP